MDTSGSSREWYDTRAVVPIIAYKLNITLNSVLQAARSGEDPSFFDVYLEGHRGTDPERPEVLCDDASTQKLVSINKYNFASFVISVINSMLCRVDILRK